jgi:hypothetical protein
MGTAYTPGLTVSANTTVRKTRRLPLKGTVVVKEGEAVDPQTVVARSEVPGILRTVRAADVLGIDADELPGVLQIQQGDAVTQGQVLARSSAFFGLFKSECRSPIDGVVELISSVSGHIGIREKPSPIEVAAYIRGRVAEVMEGEGVVVETRGAFIQGIFGVGGERQGVLKMAVGDPGQPITEAEIRAEHRGLVLTGGSNISGAALRRAAELGVAGIVVGAIIDRDLIDFLGYDIGVAITGHEAIDITLIITEGFGSIRMADRTFRLLASLEGQLASINGATQIRAGVMRPEVVVPHAATAAVAAEKEAEQDLEIGTPIRVIREPYFGRLGTVAGLPPELQPIPSGAKVRVLEATLDGERVTVPRANVEIIEQ